MNPRPNSTRANIGILEGKNVRWVYLHDHGRADEILVEHYNTVPRINQLLALGNLSAIGSKIGKRHSFEYEDRPRDTVTAYHRDRGDELDPPTVTPVREYGTDPMIDYHYLFRDGQWVYRRPSGQWKFVATDKPVTAEGEEGAREGAEAHAPREARPRGPAVVLLALEHRRVTSPPTRPRLAGISDLDGPVSCCVERTA